MTTLTPEKEAELRLRAGLDAWAVIFPGAADERIADITTILATLSTERQAREASEKEVERLTVELAAERYNHAHAHQLRSIAEAKLAALATAAREVLDGLRARIEQAPETAVPVFAGIAELHAALSALPPPVPAEEGGAREHRFGSPPAPVVNPSEAWCDAYADWYYQGSR